VSTEIPSYLIFSIVISGMTQAEIRSLEISPAYTNILFQYMVHCNICGQMAVTFVVKELPLLNKGRKNHRGSQFILLHSHMFQPIFRETLNPSVVAGHYNVWYISLFNIYTGSSLFTPGLRSWKSHANQTKFPSKTVYFLEFRGLTTPFYVVYDYITSGHADLQNIYVLYTQYIQ
jgi:hypothetical protein